MSRNLVNYPEACRFFLQGRCNRGNNCRWSHEVSASPNETLAHLSTYGGSINYLEPLGIPVIEPTLPLRAAENNNPTRYERPPWQRNGRASSSAKGKGKAPVQSQETNSIMESSSGVGYAAASAIASSGWHRPGPSRKRNDHENIITGHETVHMNTPLSFVQNMYSTGIASNSPAESECKAKNKKEETPSTVERVLGGSMSVRFGCGISIISVSPISVSSSSIIIENAPLDTTMGTLQALVRPFKPTISPYAIRTSTRGDSLRVIVHFDDTVAADEAIKGLVDTELGGRTLVAKALKPTAASQDITKIECSWYAATASAILRLESKAEATELIELSTRLDKRIRGRRIKALAQPDRVGRLGVPLSAAVMLVNLDPATTREEIHAQFPCASLQLRKPKYDMSKDETLQYIRRKFEVDRIEDLRVTSGPTESRIRAVMTFASANDAKAVYEKVKALDDVVFNKMNFTYSLKYSVQFHIPSNTWKAVKEEVDKLVNEEKEMERNMRESEEKVDDEDAPARVNIVERGGFAPVNVHIHGGGRPAVVKIKGAIQKLLNGKTVCDTEGNPLWDAALRGVEGRRLVQMVVESGVHVYVDHRTRRIILYGSPDRIMAAEELMKEQYALLLTMQHELSLEGNFGRLALQGGIAAVQEHLGEEMIVVDHERHRVLVRCSPADIGHVRTLLYNPRRNRAHLLAHGPAAIVDTTKQAEDACPVCMVPADPPVVKLSCGHTYCRACIHGFIKATIDGQKFPINCFHTSEEGHACETPLSISIISEILSKSDSEQLFEIAFTTYIQAHQKEYGYCPTPDCPTVFKVTATESFITCNQCLVGICTACKNVAHNGQTCAQYKSGIDDSGYEEWKRAQGVKTCPKCSADLQKAGGCNHMTCKCGAHLCWHCMKEFDYRSIYTHMSQKCGGIFDEDALPQQLNLPPNYLQREREELDRFGAEREERVRAERLRAIRLQVMRERAERERRERAERERAERERAQQREDSGWSCVVM